MNTVSADAGGPSISHLRSQNMFDLTGVVAIVTGGSSGIGLMMASTLLANNAKVYIVDLDADKTSGLAVKYTALAKKDGGKGEMIGLGGDCSSKDEAERLAREMAEREKYVTVLFNNAGTMGKNTEKPKEETGASFKEAYSQVSTDDFTSVLSVNSFGPYFLSIAFLPLLTASKTNAPYGEKFQPQIVNTSSMNGWTKDPSTGGADYPYLMSKAAIAHMTSLLAHDFLPIGVRVNQIAPGWFVTGMSAPGSIDKWGQTTKTGAPLSFHMESKDFGFMTPVGGSGSATDVGSVALALVVNRFVNGESILVDGGTLLVHPSKY